MIIRLALFLALLATAPAHATPSAAIVTHDQLIGGNDRSFFVLRTHLIQPGSHYRFSHRLEFIEFSAWDGSRRADCLLRQTDSVDDAASPEPDWTHSETHLPPCDPIQHLRKAMAAYPAPPSTDPARWSLSIGADGIDIRRHPNEPAKPLLDWAYVARRATAMTTITDPGSGDPTCLFCEATSGLAPPEACSIAPHATTMPFSPWVFLHLTCWDGSTDISGAALYLPVSLKTFVGVPAQ